MAPTSEQPQLLDLPPDLLARIGAQLPFIERLQLSLVCRRWRDVCAGPSELWRTVDTCICRGLRAHTGGSFAPHIPGFARWFAKRETGVEELRLEVAMPEGVPFHDTYPLPVPAALLHERREPRLLVPLPLRKFAVHYRGCAWLDFGGGELSPAEWLPHLQKVALFSVALHSPPRERWADQAPPCLTDLSVIGGRLQGFEWRNAWLPPSLTALVLSEDNLNGLPHPLPSLTNLRSLVVDNNRFGMEAGVLAEDNTSLGLSLLPQLTQLEELNLSSCMLRGAPRELSALRQLRILYLHGIAYGEEPMAPQDFEPLRACTALAFLSISRNLLRELPPAVAGMPHLQALHCEENNFAALPVAPYLTNLRELLVDWRTLLASPGFLGSATQLSRLVLQRFQSLVPPVPGGGAGFITHPLGAGEALLAALAAMPSLQRVDDVYEAGNQTHWVTACGGDIGICCTGLWCPCILFGRNVELLAEEGIGSGSARTSCFNFWSIPAAFSLTSLGLLAALGGFTAHPAASQLVLRSIQHGCYAAGATALASYASRRRSQLRQLEGLPEGPLSDRWSYFWCPGLTVCQEAAQLKHCQRRRLDAEAGGHRRTTVQPPPLQRMA
ncbi:hypothetical protein COHA_001292 [Chlorella ohadii]|uniref:F-box domain-containing protein n=1 Tax=Chlorella ohadii TaxID=2649997 RepID=A0AAD5DZP4_9CHLO|nr:hypothetical protein COHA_001292 [Chlorella ohadii]